MSVEVLQEPEHGCLIARNRDPGVLYASSSGGVFHALASVIVEEGGVVVAAEYHSAAVRHVVVDAPGDLMRLVGSKYVQSDASAVYADVFEKLARGTIVLFAGTPCQVVALKRYLVVMGWGGDVGRLYSVDLVCHGVGSPLALEKYVDERAEDGFVIEQLDMRCKHYGYRSACMELRDPGGKMRHTSTATDDFLRSYFKNLITRPSCHECRFKQVSRSSDVTLYDSWNAEALLGVPPDAKGFTNVLVHSERGVELLSKASGRLEAHPVPFSAICPKGGGGNICNSVKPHPRRDEFLGIMVERGLGKAADAVCPVTTKERLVDIVKRALSRLGLLDAATRFKRGMR